MDRTWFIIQSSITVQVAPQLPTGMVTDALWTDINGDDLIDLIIVGEWMPIMIFKNNGATFTDITIDAGLSQSSGWWNCIQEADIDNDGDIDFLAGNLGINSKLKTSEKNPVSLYVKDFDRNGNIDQILCLQKNGLDIPFATRDELLKQIPGLGSNIPSYSGYSKVRSIDDLFSKEQLRNIPVREAKAFHSSYIENLGNETFKIHHLPTEAQFAPVLSILPGDFDKDEHMDLLLGGNFNGASINLGLYDASYGFFLKGDGNGAFTTVPFDCGWFIKGEIRDLKRVNLHDGRTLIMVARNNDSIQIFNWMNK